MARTAHGVGKVSVMYESMVQAVRNRGVSVAIEDFGNRPRVIVGDREDAGGTIEFLFSAEDCPLWEASIDSYSPDGVFLDWETREGPAVGSRVAVVADWIVSVIEEGMGGGERNGSIRP